MNTSVINNPTTPASTFVDQAADSASGAIRSTQTVANSAFDRLNDQVETARDRAVPLVDRLTSQAEGVARRSVEAMRDTSAQLRDRATRASESTVGYIKGEPVKAMLIAAAVGAALMALVGLVSRSRSVD